jgi:hypothetical protein
MSCRDLVPSIVGSVLLAASATLKSADCNSNGVDDAVDIMPRAFGFEALFVLESQHVAYSVLALDLDGDADTDLVAAEAASRDEPGLVTVFRNPFVPGARGVETAVGNYLKTLAAADLDADGDLDLVTGSFFAEQISVLANQGDGTFASALDFPAGGEPQTLTTSDLDADGDTDVAAGLTSGLSLHFNDGSGRFVAGELLLGDESVTATAAGDLDRDGDLDLAASALPVQALPAQAANYGSVVVLINFGDGSFSRSAAVPLAGEGTGLGALDLDGDADVDLAVAVPVPGHLAVIANDGAGGFAPPSSHAADRPMTLAPADMDGDGDPDLSAADMRTTRSGPSMATVFVNDGSGGFSRRKTLEFEEPYVPASLATGDLDQDGLPEIALSGNGRIALFRNTTLPPVSLDLNQDGVPGECQPKFVRGDANTDGSIDIADPIITLLHLFAALQGALPCAESADADGNGRLELTDAVYILGYLFLGRLPPPPPFPICGPDPSGSGLECLAYLSCQ